MSVKLLFNQIPQFFDSNGNPASGYKLYAYAAGSSTKQSVYTTTLGNVAHSNPITLDSRGEPSAAIWGTVGLTYKLVLTADTSNDPPLSSIWTIDNVSPINDTSLTLDQWTDSGDTPTYVSATSFTIPTDKTSTYTVGRRIKTTNTAGAVYSRISASAYTSLTTVTVVNDSTTLDSGLSAVQLAILTPSNSSLPFRSHSGLIENFAGALRESAVITPASFAAAQNNYAPTDFAKARVVRLTATGATRAITGLAGGEAGRVVTLINIGGQDIVLSSNDVSSSDGNKFLFGQASITSVTLYANGGSIELWYDIADGYWKAVNSSITEADQGTFGLVQYADGTDQLTGTSTTRAVSSGVQVYHDSAAKGWCYFAPIGGTGAVTADKAFNVASVDDDGTGDFGVNWATDLDSANYVAVGSARSAAGTSNIFNTDTHAAGATEIFIEGDGGAAADPSAVSIVVFGRY